MKTTACNINFILLFFLLAFNTSFSQCVEEQLVIGGNQGPNVGSSSGQQFVACETGEINNVELNIHSGKGMMKLEIYDGGNNWNNLMWVVDSIPIDSSGNIVIDLKNGNGNSLNVIQNNHYALRFWSIDTTHFTLGSKLSTIDPYPYGAALKHNGSVQNFTPSFMDFYFRIEFNSVLLTSNKHENIQNNINIYPNPTSDYLSIEGINPQKLSIYDISGKEVSELLIDNETIDISELKKGVYFLKFSMNDQVFFKKVVKNK